MSSDEADWSSNIYIEACPSNDDLPLRLGLRGVHNRHNALLTFDLDRYSKQMLLSERSG